MLEIQTLHPEKSSLPRKCPAGSQGKEDVHIASKKIKKIKKDQTKLASGGHVFIHKAAFSPPRSTGNLSTSAGSTLKFDMSSGNLRDYGSGFFFWTQRGG